jgi:predicted metalloprotease with PDZ domain
LLVLVQKDCEAHKLGMKVGDEIVSVNETSFKMMSIDEAYDYLSTQPHLEIVLQESGFLPAQMASTLDVDWISPFGRHIQSPSEQTQPPTSLIRRIRMSFSQAISKNKFKLGFSMRGGIENNLGVFVSRVKFGSNASLNGLRVGDQLLSVNNVKLTQLTLADAFSVIKYNLVKYHALNVLVRYIGKVPVLPADDMDVSTIRLSKPQPGAKLPPNANKLQFNFVQFYLRQYVRDTLPLETLLHELYKRFDSATRVS